ncbi:competence protein CoiA family protein, partial [Streptomyces botrytidirepellens]
MPRDQRLVQTAVIGSTESEIPVVLPMQAGEVTAFRRAHATDSFWCGRWLGGCGGRLIIKTYQDRICHFAHLSEPGRGPCRRASLGMDSADHLYIKQQILAWLAGQSITARASIPQDAERPGAEVLFEPDRHGCLRVLLGAQAAPSTAADSTQLVLGPHIPHNPYRLTVDGYVLRIRCDTDGIGRRVMIGTQTHEGTQWFGLDECRLAPWGLSTPAVEEVRRLRGTVRPLGVLAPRTELAGPTAVARPVATPQAHDDRVAALAALQKAIEADRSVSELRHHLTHAEAAVNGGASAAENELLRRATDLLLRKERGVGVSPPPAPARRRGRLSRPEHRP